MTAGNWNFTIEQGATFTRTILIEDDSVARDLTGYIARMMLRKSIGNDTVILSLAIGSGLSIPTPANGEIIITITDEQTAALDFETAVYDLELETAGGDVERLLQGRIILSKEVTRPAP